jgi:hypothetical protein
MKPDFISIRKAILGIISMFGGKFTIKEWQSGDTTVLKVVLLWETRKEQSKAA